MAKSKIVEVNEKIATGVTEGYKKIKNGVVEGYKKIEEGESVEDAKRRPKSSDFPMNC